VSTPPLVAYIFLGLPQIDMLLLTIIAFYVLIHQMLRPSQSVLFSIKSKAIAFHPFP